jgi:hypothetical protein
VSAEEAEFGLKASQLVGKYQSMLSKYHILLLQESTRLCSSSEEVMLARYWEAEERASLAREKEEYVRNNARIEELKTLHAMGAAAAADVDELEQLLERMEPAFPPVPPAWAAKYEQVVGRPLDMAASQAAMRRKEAIKQRVFTRKADKLLLPQQQQPTQQQQQQQHVVADVSIKREKVDEEEEEDDCGMPQLEDQREFVYRSRVARHHQHAATSPDNNTLPPPPPVPPAKRLAEVRVSLTNVLKRENSEEEESSAAVLHNTNSTAASALISPPSTAAAPEGVCAPGPSSSAAVFVGLKFNRTSSGRWSASLKRDLEDGEEEDAAEASTTGDHAGHTAAGRPFSPGVHHHQVNKRCRLDVAVPSSSSRLINDFNSDSDEDFSLADVGGGHVVQSMLEEEEEEENDDDEDEDDDDDDDDDDIVERGRNFLSGTGAARTETPQSDNDSVQNAINSILDMQERGDVQTPEDLRNLTGLLDAMEGEEEEGEDADPTLDAAVKSIL